MAFRVELPRPPTIGDVVTGAVKSAGLSFLKFYGIFFVTGFLSIIVAYTIPPLTFPFFFGGLAYALRRPIRAIYRAFTVSPDYGEALEREPEEEPPPPIEGLLAGLRIDDDPPKEFYFPHPLRNRHCYLIGKTRTGKTTLIKNFIRQDLEAGAGLCFVDPHGDAADELLGYVPRDRADDVIYFDPSAANTQGFNIFQLPFPPYKLTEDIISVFKMFFGDSWGYRMEHILRYTILTLLYQKEPRTLRDLRTIFTSPSFREDIAYGAEQETLREFWQKEFPSIEKGAVNPIINKLSALLSPTSPLERLFSRPENDLNFSEIMNTGKILIVNLSKGLLGDEPSRLLGGLITTGIQQAALARADIPEKERRPFYFYLDEFHNFAVASFETILSESAKYKLNLMLANQSLSQLSGSLQRSIFANVATIISFQISAEDAGSLQREMHRSRFLVRPHESNTFSPVSDFLERQKEIYRVALADKWAGLPPAELEQWKKKRLAGFAGEAGFQQELAARRVKMKNILETMERGSLDPRFMKEIFPDYEIRELTFPNVDDFINLPPHHAFARMERADNVFPIRTLPAPDPDQETREIILAANAARFAERAPVAPLSDNGAAVKEEPNPPEQPRQEAPVPQKKARKVKKDYKF